MALLKKAKRASSNERNQASHTSEWHVRLNFIATRNALHNYQYKNGGAEVLTCSNFFKRTSATIAAEIEILYIELSLSKVAIHLMSLVSMNLTSPRPTKANVDI